MENLSTAFVDIIKDDKLQDVTKELTEFTIDSVLKDGLLKDFPVINVLTGLYSINSSIQDKLFLKKIIAFIKNLDDTTARERQEMISNIETSEEYGIKVGEKLLFLIDKCDDYSKAGIVGSLFNQVAKKNLTYDEFLLCCIIVEKCLIKDLIGFVKDYKNSYTMTNDNDLLNWGLLAIKNIKEQIIVLEVSTGGRLLKKNLIPYIDSRIQMQGLRNKNLFEIETYFIRIFEKYSTLTRWYESGQSIMEAVAELCNNFIISDDDFNTIVFKVHMQGLGLFRMTETYITLLQRRENFHNNEFNLERWRKYLSYYAWNQNKINVEKYNRPIEPHSIL
ncbi:hypothetical protein [Flavobacterium nitrogenifigens]|uniref:Uncharacterized protein n=1 Tax=Flavobacterium nitrogenifigens TaxID=1617283 RepID=A0A521AFB1_9FLAO|nr:hypothetical protein [Flavobacterium nitrogenifigens]KAF2331492.1 hypothetical protein DM397_12200 [Flavobacterium nitrogenifigens]SMO33514.1 hypothetical protein SAMN06265220_10190 [Flavobacterium nitrogenifigens]